MQIRIAAVLGVLLTVTGCRVIEPAPPPSAPRIDSFTASKTRIAPGEEVTLTFAATGATKIELTDDSGNSVQLDGAAEAGTAKVAPSRTAFYVLRATGAGGRDTAFVQIAVNEPLKDLFLIAVPATINSGEQAQLLWGAPGASSVTIKYGSGQAMPLTGTTGSFTVTPATSEQYTLTAQGAPNTPPLTALAEVQVRPVLTSAKVESPDGVQPTKTITFSWKTAGAARINISEQTFGQLATLTDPSDVANGTFDYVIPSALPNGIEVSDGLPLRFVVSATQGTFTVAQTLAVVVGDLPVIEEVLAPEFASTGRTFDISWKTLNATSVTISSGGLAVFQTNTQSRVDQGTLNLQVPSVQTDFVLVASNARGASVQRTFNLRPVALPTITTFTLTPTINALGDPATARWTTTNAVRVVLRFEDGPTLAVVATPSQVASGNVVLTPATSGRVVLEASNAAGDVVKEVKAINFTGSAVSINPTPVVRGTPAVLNWTLASAGVLEVVGLPTGPITPFPNSPNFVDLTTVTTAQAVTISDPTNGSAKLTLPAGFRFPFLGQVRPELFVSVDGFIAFSDPGTMNSNVDLADGGAAPSLIAPLWDDLTMGTGSQVLTALQQAATGERFLVVQWEKLQLAGNASSELTFEVHLYETGQVAFLYKTLTGPLNSATVGVKDTDWPVAQQYAFNSSSTVPSVDLELNFFTGGAADSMLNLNAGPSRQISFFGRTATGLVPASTQLRSFGPGDVSVSEAMPFPEVSASALGQWVELHNNQNLAVDFDGLTVQSTGSSVDGGYVIPPGTVVPAGGYLVLGQSVDTTDNGGAPVTQVLTDLPLGSVERVRVLLEGVTLGQLTWDAGTPGTSIVAPQPVLVASGNTFTCNRSATFGSAGALGTPGAKNEACAPYVVTSIAGAFSTAPAGSEILTTIDPDSGYGNGTLPVPFTYFGTPYTAFSLSTNGFITFGSPLTSSYTLNDSVVAVSQPNGVVAVFWDDLDRVTGKNAMWRQSDRTIISWEGYAIWLTTSSLNMQIHLLDNGVIEFHYGTLSTTSTTQSTIDSVLGSSATAWLERPDGVIAVPWSINKLNAFAPNSGLRFTPVP